ncbi:hypothetical protein DYB31_002668 [Aphanomyces astaci]|uniref:Hsp70-Hsp90 organising protein n=1 Tax=Aphanomyces astaci TaxID=112090 RepID=A0A397FL55_APHAT|nr:hypothetical protein DYB31_002668 [Aphanomyces astaci]
MLPDTTGALAATVFISTEMSSTTKTKAEAKKNEGNEFFKKGKFAEAIEKYSDAITLDPTNHVYYSNRSAAFLGQLHYQDAADDGEKCVTLNPQFVKGYHRYALGLKGIKQYAKALEVLKAGQKVDFDNKDLNRLINEIEPLLAKVEHARRSGLNPSEQLKEQGNDLFKAASFEKAIEVYGEAINACEKDNSPVAISCYNNRAACHQQLSNFSAVIRDCSHVLEYDPENQKALLRRGLAYEGLERYRLALQDIRAVLALNPQPVGRLAPRRSKAESPLSATSVLIMRGGVKGIPATSPASRVSPTLYYASSLNTAKRPLPQLHASGILRISACKLPTAPPSTHPP